MSTEGHPESADEIFQAVSGLTAEARDRYLDEHCPDPEIRAEVVSLLAEHDTVATGSTRAFDPQPRLDPDVVSLGQLDEFRIVRRIGIGGMASVYLAEDTTLGRQVALKVLPTQYTQSETRVARFRHEAKAVAGLNHVNIVPVHRVGFAHGLHFIVMEYVEGMTFADAIRRRKESRNRSTRTTLDEIRSTATMIAEVADALDHAHQHNIIHRDIKPSNILIDSDGRPRLADFGIAKHYGGDTITEHGGVPGTLPYMSPEQAAALTTKIDMRSDVFSLGVVLYEGLALRLPFSGRTTQDVVHQIISKEPKRVGSLNSSVPRDLETICQKAMEKDPLNRYQSAGHLAADLRAFVGGRPILARPPSVVRRARRALVRHRTASLAALLAISIVAIGVLLGASELRRRARMVRLTVTTDRNDVSVVARRFLEDQTLGPAVRLGSAPVESALLEPGLYWLTLVSENGAFTETSALMRQPQEQYTIHASIPATADVIQHMTLIPVNEHRLGRPGTDYELEIDRLVRLPAFYIDATEVSNGQFLEFVEATGHPPPEHWQDGRLDPALANRPVVGIRRREAEAYARWRGKRLPTLEEWEAAARFPDGRRWPWGDGPPPLDLPISVEMIRLALSQDQGRLLSGYLRHTVDVGSMPELNTDRSLHHMFGNVREYTMNIDFTRGEDVVIKGGAWWHVPADWDLAQTLTTDCDTWSYIRGFRCARSMAANTDR